MEILLYVISNNDSSAPQIWKYTTAAGALKDYEKTTVYKSIEVIYITNHSKPISLDDLKLLNLLHS